jgi:beta-phosphoglucomutase-like phosphatase (HAD superfamily)
MIKAILFDLDGVLIDSKEIHFNALNLALDEFGNHYIISRKEQDATFEGLTTNVKLDILTKTKGLPRDLHEDVWRRKQEYSAKLFESTSKDEELISIFGFIKSRGIKIAVASNSIRQTLDTCLKSLGVIDYVDYSLSNEDVKYPKPDPQIYNRCMEYLTVSPKETVIFEDSEIGLRAATATGARVEKVLNRKDVYFDRIDRVIHEA